MFGITHVAVLMRSLRIVKEGVQKGRETKEKILQLALLFFVMTLASRFAQDTILLKIAFGLWGTMRQELLLHCLSSKELRMKRGF
jgi:SNF family Na+-dependent transporter